MWSQNLMLDRGYCQKGNCEPRVVAQVLPWCSALRWCGASCLAPETVLRARGRGVPPPPPVRGDYRGALGGGGQCMLDGVTFPTAQFLRSNVRVCPERMCGYGFEARHAVGFVHCVGNYVQLCTLCATMCNYAQKTSAIGSCGAISGSPGAALCDVPCPQVGARRPNRGGRCCARQWGE